MRITIEQPDNGTVDPLGSVPRAKVTVEQGGVRYRFEVEGMAIGEIKVARDYDLLGALGPLGALAIQSGTWTLHQEGSVVLDTMVREVVPENPPCHPPCQREGHHGHCIANCPNGSAVP